MPNDLVGYSRAGDVFHYRWAARRCLRLIYPNSHIQKIVVEGSSEDGKDGEYVIDVSEYITIPSQPKKIAYYQLKHSTVQLDEPFTLSDLEGTFTGFAKRFVQHQKDTGFDLANISFTIITNRPIDEGFKNKISAVSQKGIVDDRFKKTLEKYTDLTLDDLALFCGLVKLDDDQGDYTAQKSELKLELAKLIASPIDNTQIDTLVALVQEKILPNDDGLIQKEDVLKRFGITSERELYPAPSVWEELKTPIDRKQYHDLKEKISTTLHPVIVHAAGGVGKSVFCRQLVSSLPQGSLGISYDCFGAGRYRNRSEARHRHKDALVQIVNELATMGLCEPLLVLNTTLEDDIMRRFLISLEAAANALKKIDASAELFIIIDAADNAEMAAQEFSQPCFAHELIKEKIPVGCKLVMLCRTERISLLKAPSTVIQLELEPFSQNETWQNLRTVFPAASDQEALEFHRLTAGNPRVQANSLYVKYNSVSQLLSYLGPVGTSVEKQIEIQLDAAVSKIKDALSEAYQGHVDAICIGLASLPPYIPIDLLAKAANVKNEDVRSFISEMGRSLWLTENAVQFRDEPTETWFRNTFLATKSNLENYINIIEPIAFSSSYAAEVLPQLYLQAEQYDKLIQVALSEDYLPKNNPIEERNARVYRLQFAFKAALKSKRYKDAIKLAVRAGEEVAGNQRQLNLLGDNTDLLVLLQSNQKVQETAFKRSLKGLWEGSANAYTAALLSGIKEYHGEAISYLRAAENWLGIYYDDLQKKNDLRFNNEVSDNDIIQLAQAYLNIYGAEGCIDFLRRFTSKRYIFSITQTLIRTLIDAGKFGAINELLQLTLREPYFTVPMVSELIQVGHFPEAATIKTCLDLLCCKKCRITKSTDFFNDSITPAFLNFLDACLYNNLSSAQILRVLRYYVPLIPSQLVQSSYQSNERHIYIKALAIRALLSGNFEIDVMAILPKNLIGKEKDHTAQNEITEFKEVINGLLPWLLLRSKMLVEKQPELSTLISRANESSKKARTGRYRSHDPLPNEIAAICTSILIICNHVKPEEVKEAYSNFLEKDPAFNIVNRLNIVRAAYRATHLSAVAAQAEESAYRLLKKYHSDGPEEIAARYISLARAVMITSINDASFYFDEAIKIANKFGDEIVQRWETFVSMAKRSCETKTVNNELAYRFIRCAELVGENVYREKYWDREGALRVCTKMSSGIGISALSRWRDRRVGVFEYQLDTVLKQLVTSKSIKPSVAWALTRFDYNNSVDGYLSIFLNEESSNFVRQHMLDDTVEILQREGMHSTHWNKLKEIADKFNLNNETLNSIVGFYKSRNVRNISKDLSEESPKRGVELTRNNEWDSLWGDELLIDDRQAVSGLIDKFIKGSTEQNKNNYRIQDFLKRILFRISENFLLEFIDIVMSLEYVNYYDVESVLNSIPQEWASKVGFKKKWPEIVYRYGKQYAHALANVYSLKSVIEGLKLDADLIVKLKEGICSGLAQGYEFADASIFFGFVNLASSFINEDDALEVLDFSMSRFELHIDTDFGDGVWGDWLQVSDDSSKNIAGLIWSALGAPDAATRWKAVHCVVKLADLNCEDILNNLIHWFEYNKVDAFGCNQFPFYSFHARQYLLVALKRISQQQPQLLGKYSEIFSKYALREDHILIKKLSSEIAIEIENHSPGTYQNEILTSLKNCSVSKFQVEQRDYKYSVNSYLHDLGQVDINIDYSFGLDFEHYWFEPLGKVFGVPGKQMEELAANVIVKEWNRVEDDTYNSDPRVSLWTRSSSDDRETWHDHESYPKTDNLSFYHSYHAMMIVAGRLLERMPIISRSVSGDNEWEEWLSRHLLNSSDGSWLFDHRAPLPLNRSSWILENKNDTWQSEITVENFFNSLKVERNGSLWINVNGNWDERKEHRVECISIDSALVSKKTSESLLQALSTCSNPQDYKLPDYGEERMEIEYDNFLLKGWITDYSVETGLDRFDPFANNIRYPSSYVGDSIQTSLGLTFANAGKFWYNNVAKEPLLMCESWRGYQEKREEDPEQYGIWLNASLPFLKELCKTLDCEVIFDVGISRNFERRYRGDNQEYSLGQHKIFVLSSDGKLRTTDASYQLG